MSATELSELCYQYKYDYRNRLIEKKIPGKGDANTFESIVYNKLDQPILTQDALLKQESQWLFTKYDALGRVAYTGKMTDTRTRSVIQDEATAYSEDLWVTRGAAVTIGGTTMYYTDGGYPKVNGGETLTINYYDDYEFLGTTPIQELANPGTVSGEAITNRTRSLPTGSKVKVLGEDTWITTVPYYDKKARQIYVASKNEYLATTDIIESKLDFVGKVLETKTTHTKGSNAAIVTVDKFDYDHMGRVMKQTQTLNGQEEVIAENTYDALGQLISKKVGGGLQDVDYKYNVRGWLQNINADSKNDNDLFNFSLSYANPQHGATALFNGNISETTWQTANDNLERYYTYEFDNLNRILSATSSNGKYNLSNVSYNKMGGILSITRTGWQNSSNFADMDILNYEYDAGNKPLKITDTGNKAYGFKDGTNTNNDFEYDANGSRTIDRNKGITGISYNHFNLPTQITVSNTDHNGNVKFIYDANGVKLRKLVTDNGTNNTTDYSGNYIYENGVLKSIQHAEGYIEPETNGSFSYVYQYKDHVQNVRISYSDRDKNGSISTAEILEENSYYPFGGKHGGYNTRIESTNPALRFKFANMELNQELGLGMYDFGARQMDEWDPTWWQIDPKAELMRRHSPYNYAFDNPIYYMDPDGMMALGTGNPIKKIKRAGRAIKRSLVASHARNKRQVKEIISSLKSFSDKLVGKMGGIMFTSKKGSSGDPKMNRKASREDSKDVPMVEADGLMQAGSMAKSDRGGKKTRIDKAMKDFVAGNKKSGKLAEKGMEIADGVEKDTTITAEFAGEIIETKGTAVIHSRRDSTATMNKTEVANFNKQSELSLQKQEQEVDQLLENRN